jgi:hypothetical protein
VPAAALISKRPSDLDWSVQMSQIIPVFVKVDAAFAAKAVEHASARLQDGGWVDFVREYLAGHDHFPAVAAAILLGGYAGEHALAPAMRWLADDPPDEAFSVPVRLKRSHVRPAFVIYPPVPLGEDALALFHDADYAAAATRAMLRATEREQGALNVGDRVSARTRAGERDHFRAVASDGLNAAARAYVTLGADLQPLEGSVERKGSEGLTRQNRRQVEQLLLDSRVPTHWATLGQVRRDLEGTSGLSETLSNAGKACSKIAVALQRWRTAAI